MSTTATHKQPSHNPTSPANPSEPQRLAIKHPQFGIVATGGIVDLDDFDTIASDLQPVLIPVERKEPTTSPDPDWHPDLAVRTAREVEKLDGPIQFRPDNPWVLEFVCDVDGVVFEECTIAVRNCGQDWEAAAEKAQLFVEAIRRKGAVVYDGDDGEPDEAAVAAVMAMLKGAIAQFPVSQHDSLCAQLMDAWRESEAARGVVDVDAACACEADPEPQPECSDSQTYSVVMVDVPQDWQPTSDRALPPGATNSIPFDLAEKLAVEWNRQRLATAARIDHWSVVASYKGKHRVLNVSVTAGWQPTDPHQLPPATIHTSYSPNNGMAATAAVTACNRIIRETGESIDRWAVRIVQLKPAAETVGLWFSNGMPFTEYDKAINHARILNDACDTDHWPVYRAATLQN